MSLIRHELRLLLRARMALAALLLVAILSAASVIAGMVEVAHQRDVIARIAPQQAQDIAAVAKWVDKEKDAGSAAYYSFHPTWDAPAPLAFAALGLRDVSPYILRVRALGLEAQLYDGEAFNPELALPGRFDFAFVLIYLAPLFVIALFHDLVSGEREEGRLRMLNALPGQGRRLWLRRAALRFGLLYAAVALPLLAGAILSAVGVMPILIVLTLTAAYLVLWIGVTMLIGRARWSSVANAATLAGLWLVITLVLPTIAHVAINQAIPVGEGVELTLAHREAVNRAWDIPREDTMRRFYAGHPEWANSPPLPPTFHYKWYLAFHQVGDESVAGQVSAYRSGLEARDRAAHKVGLLLPSVGVQSLLARLANTDVQAQLAYQDRIRAYHAALRRFYYSYLFTDKPFGREDFDRAPRFAEN
ncbi:MAG: ABC transporter permease [Sphingobium sp.]